MAGITVKINTTILIAPLDWGLGHATRCIPIIKYLLQKQCRVVVAATGYHLILLQQEFPAITFIHLGGYGIKYGKKNVLFKLALQLPQLYKTIKKENIWLDAVIDTYKISAVISDNRYGLYSKKVPCVFITHQLQLKVPQIFNWMESIIRKGMYTYVNRFAACWVPDMPEAVQSLAGTLSHPRILPMVPVTYIGWLTRFGSQPPLPKIYLACISLSGPEPQRTILESVILKQITDTPGNFLLIRGLPGADILATVPANVTIHNHLPAVALQHAFLQSQYIVSRSGYSTLMDMAVLKCKCIFIPTPGQTEQEYLGLCLAAKKMAIVKSQSNFNLKEALKEAKDFPFDAGEAYKNTLMGMAMDEWLLSLQ